jgi:dTDP-4-amino-4,6-dideoxygalactose transaminase
MIPFNRATFAGRELELLGAAIGQGHVSGNGPFTKQAEVLLAGIHGCGDSLLTTSCTHALEMAALLLDMKPGDEVIVPSYTFVSTASAFLLHGGTPVFVDVRQDTLNIDADAVEDAITPNTRAICIVHYAGVAADPERFKSIASRHNLLLIEDNAHGLFASFSGKPLGTFGALSTMSFHETKNITCGEGGAIQINNKELVDRAEILREKGTDRSRFFRGQIDKYTWVDVGSSWVLSDLLAAVLVGQLERSDEIQESRSRIWRNYENSLSSWASEYGIQTPVVPAGCEHSSHMYHLRFDDLDTRTRFISHLRANQISAVFHYQPLHLSDVGMRLGGRKGQCPVSENAGDTLVRLPLYSALNNSELGQIIEAVASFRP